MKLGCNCIDVHTHVLPPGWEDIAGDFGISGWPSLKMHSNCQAAIMLGEREFRKITDQCFAPTTRIADMERTGVRKQMISPIPVLFCYWGAAEATARFAAIQNDYISKLVADFPERFIGAATVAMQSPKHAIAELERVKKNGFRCVEIGTNVNGLYPDDAPFEEILTAAEDLDLAVFVHPWDGFGEDQIRRFYLPHMIALPAETSLCISRMIAGGVFDRRKNLRIAFAHGGGSFIPLLSRIDHGYRMRPEMKSGGSNLPSSYLRRMFFDSITHSAEQLRTIIAAAGSDRVMLGSDYPFDMGVADPVRELEEANLSASEKDDILFRSASEFLKL
jgi:aminocarboxymuconate-semialdehyde decarboxylase